MERSRDRRAAALLALATGGLAAVDAQAAEEGLELFPDWRFELPLLVAFFAAVVPIVNRLLLQPLLRVLDARAERTDGARSRAAGLEEQVRELIARYERELAEARQAAEASRRELLEQARRGAAEATLAARGDAEQEIARARREVARAFASARESLRAQSAELAREAAASVLGRIVA